LKLTWGERKINKNFQSCKKESQKRESNHRGGDGKALGKVKIWKTFGQRALKITLRSGDAVGANQDQSYRLKMGWYVVKQHGPPEQKLEQAHRGGVLEKKARTIRVPGSDRNWQKNPEKRAPEKVKQNSF